MPSALPWVVVLRVKQTIAMGCETEVRSTCINSHTNTCTRTCVPNADGTGKKRGLAYFKWPKCQKKNKTTPPKKPQTPKPKTKTPLHLY